MRGKELLDKMEYIDPVYIEAADIAEKKRKKNLIKWIGTAACLCLIASVIFIVQKTGAPVQPDTGITVSENGITIPQMKVNLTSNVSADMIAFFIYHGHCYVQYEWTDNADIVGEYLGTVTGLIDEWTPKKGYVELAGSIKGDFFSVKGFDPEFMLCRIDDTGAVSTYIRDNGITLKYGAELYEDLLHLSENYSAVRYETRDSWYYSRNELFQMNGGNGIIGGFIEQIDKAEFIVWDEAVANEGMTASSAYDTEIYHLYFAMSNGMTVHLRLYEKGYVRFDGLLDICVKVPEDSFNELIGILNDHTDSKPADIPDKKSIDFEKCRNDPELGSYIPTFEIPGCSLLFSEVFYYFEPHTSTETGTKQIYIEYTCESNQQIHYAVTITWKSEYGNNGWAGTMIDNSELSVEAIRANEEIYNSGVSRIDVGVWYDDVSVVLYSSGIDAESAYEIFRSVR